MLARITRTPGDDIIDGLPTRAAGPIRKAAISAGSASPARMAWNAAPISSGEGRSPAASLPTALRTASLISRPPSSGSSPASTLPYWEPIDSGWNCTPNTGRVAWLTAITSPSAVSASTVSTFGMSFAADRQRVIAHGFEMLWHACEQFAAQHFHVPSLAVNDVLRAFDDPAHRLSDRLVAEANAKNRQVVRSEVDQLEADARHRPACRGRATARWRLHPSPVPPWPSARRCARPRLPRRG